jgi:hypothetical protein
MSRADDFPWRVRALRQQADYGSDIARLNSANAEVAANQGEVDRLNACGASRRSSRRSADRLSSHAKRSSSSSFPPLTIVVELLPRLLRSSKGLGGNRSPAMSTMEHSQILKTWHFF